MLQSFTLRGVKWVWLSSLVVDGEFFDYIKVADHNTELFKRDLSVEVSVSLHNGAIDKLLELDVIEVGADHHLEHLEELTVRNEAIVVDVVDLESETELVLLGGAG